MTRLDDDTEGPRPYRTYKARRPKRSHVDDELAGARPARETRGHDKGEAGAGRTPSAYPARSGKAYSTYGAAPAAGKAGKKGSKGAGSAPRRRRRFRWWYIPVGILALGIIAGVVLTVLAWPGYQKFDRAVDKANKRIDKKTRAQLTADDGWIWRNGSTLLLLGVDKRATDTNGRSDTIMLMRFNPKTHTINQLSIPRDTRVAIEGRGDDKINTAMYWGGPSLAIKTIEQFTGIPINHVMVVNFQGFPRLVNAVGGVDMMVPQTVSTIAGSNARPVVFKQGMHHFDGKYAMLYVRIRHAYAEGDITRAARQQVFVQALQKKIAQPSNLTKLPEIGKKFMSGVATDLTTNQILELAYLKWRATGGKKIVMAGTGGLLGGVSYVFPPDEATRERMVKRFLTN